MALRIRRRWVFLLGGVVLLTVLVYGTARFADEPLRRYMEAEVNRRLTGYTVQIAALRVHPWTASVELRDATIAQNANPDPPVAQVARLVTRIDWRALLHRRVVADISFERPTVYLNLKQVRTEASESTALKDRGWQQALEALAFDLKINRLRVVDGDITYVDQGPFKPLHVSRVNLGAENIRNIASKEQVYPSPILLEAVVFDVGAVRLDGRADFLAEPHVGLQAALRLNQAAKPAYRLQLTDTNLTLEHLGNQGRDGPAVARLTGQLMGRGETRLTVSLQPQAGSADMDVTAQIEDADLVRLKDLVRAYGGFEIRAGEFSVYSELQMKGGAIEGYVKPLFRGVEIGTDGEAVAEKGLRQRLYEGLVGIGAKVLKNRLRGEVATVVPISGRVDRPEVARWETVGRLLQNAFLRPITPGYEPARSPKGGPLTSAQESVVPDHPAREPDPVVRPEAP